MRKFTTRVSMPCTSEQFEADLRGPLEAMGYKVESLNNWGSNILLINHYYGLGTVSNVTSSSDSQSLTTYNPTLFLALAAMSEGDEFFTGEWVKCIRRKKQDLMTLGGLYEVKSFSNERDYLYIEHDASESSRWSITRFVKATKEEIITHLDAPVVADEDDEPLPRKRNKRPTFVDGKFPERTIDFKKDAEPNPGKDGVYDTAKMTHEQTHQMMTEHGWPYERIEDDDSIVGTMSIGSEPSNVDHPQHYGGDTPYEVIKVLEAWGFDKNSYRFNAIKYLARGDHKGNLKQDLEKAIWYINREIAKL